MHFDDAAVVSDLDITPPTAILTFDLKWLYDDDDDYSQFFYFDVI